MSKSTVKYESKEVQLSRPYPFGDIREIQEGRETVKVTVLVMNELTGFDDEVIAKEEASGKLGGYVQISVSTGIDYSDILMLANKDRDILMQELQGF